MDCGGDPANNPQQIRKLALVAPDEHSLARE
jgi:hypothetical protein